MSDRYDYDPYAVLGVERNASPEEIRTSYRDLIVQWHPDLCDHPEAHERTADLNEAYAIVGDPQLRAEYDGGPVGFMSQMREWLLKRRRVFSVTECQRCGKPLYGQRSVWVAPDGTEYPAYIPRRIDALYCSNACRQAAYRARKRAAERARRAQRQIECDDTPDRGPKFLEP